MCFAFVIAPGNPYYYQVPMCIIGKVYANSMLVLINSRMLLGSSEEEPVTELRFETPPTGDKENITEVHHGALSVDSDEMTRPLRGSEDM